ncbi:MAG: hypothetical protein GY861_28000 [bacterium]|nr:hypothetical protein [bacterium]
MYNFGQTSTITYHISSPIITMLDFLTPEGGSLCGKGGINYSAKFDPKVISGTVVAEDDSSYTAKVIVEKILLEGKRFYAVKVNNPNAFFRKTSGYYFLNLKLNKSSSQIKIKYPLAATNGETVCIDPLDPELTIFEPTEFLPKITMKVNQDVKIGNIILRTKKDCLYNYWVEKEKFDYNLQGCYVAKTDVEGFYDLRCKSSKGGTTWLEVTLEDYDFVGGYEITVRAEPIIAHFIPDARLNKFADKAKNILVQQSNDENTLFYFKGLDAAKNHLRLNPARYNKYLGLRLILTINGKRHISRFQRRLTSNISYDRRKRMFVVWDYYKIAGKYTVTIYGKGGSKYEYSYTKRPGKTEVSNSSCTVSSAPEIVFAKTATIALNLNDRYNAGVEQDLSHLKEELKNVKVQAYSGDMETTVNFSYTKVDGKNVIFTSAPVKRATSFKIAVKYGDSALPTPKRAAFNVRFGDIFIKNTQCSIILSKTTPISVDSTQQVANTKDIPLFKCKFYDDGKNYIGKIKEEDKTKFNTVISGKRFEITLEQEWVNDNELHFNIKKDDERDFKNAVSTSPYSLNIFYKQKKGIKYPLKFLGDGKIKMLEMETRSSLILFFTILKFPVLQETQLILFSS